MSQQLSERNVENYYASCPKDELVSALSKAAPIYEKIAEYQRKINNAQEWKITHLTGIFRFLVGAMAYSFMFGLGAVILFIITIPFPKGINTIPDTAFAILCLVVFPVLFLLLIRHFKKKRAEKIKKEMDTYISNNFCPELFCVPRHYQYYTAVKYILDCFQDYRADTLKEAINLYVEQYDRWKQENMLSEIRETNSEIAASQVFLDTAVSLGLLFK